MPKALTAGDPNYSSVLLSNLGSIKSDSCYHHLSNYGTCSIMITIGNMHKEIKIMPDGSTQTRDVINCTFTLDERIADGFYFAKSLRIAKYVLEHPETMLRPISDPVPVDL
jgi:pyruvate/2-oxoglutarate dehydrogenase complex dihydrolipoamide acyltransferase (E2) component